MTPGRLAEIRKYVDDLEFNAPSYRRQSLTMMRELLTALDQLRIDAERWQAVLKILDGHYRHPDTHKWLVQFDEALDGTMMPIHDLFTAAIDALRTQKAPG